MHGHPAQGTQHRPTGLHVMRKRPYFMPGRSIEQVPSLASEYRGLPHLGIAVSNEKCDYLRPQGANMPQPFKWQLRPHLDDKIQLMGYLRRLDKHQIRHSISHACRQLIDITAIQQDDPANALALAQQMDQKSQILVEPAGPKLDASFCEYGYSHSDT